MSRFYAAAIGRDGGTSYRHGKHSASVELGFDSGTDLRHRLWLVGFERDGVPWVRVTYNGRELAAFPFEQAGGLTWSEDDVPRALWSSPRNPLAPPGGGTVDEL